MATDPNDGGSDEITSGAGNDFIIGGTGDDRITAGAGNDLVFGDHGEIRANPTSPFVGLGTGGHLFQTIEHSHARALHLGYLSNRAADVTLITSDNPDMVAKIHELCDRNNAEMALMMAGEHGHGHGH